MRGASLLNKQDIIQTIGPEHYQDEALRQELRKQ